jgi:hypothetical protein
MHTIGWRAVDCVSIWPDLGNPERYTQRQRVTRCGTIPIRRNDDDVRNLFEGCGQSDNASSEIAIVVTYKDFHFVFNESARDWLLVLKIALTILNVYRTP